MKKTSNDQCEQVKAGGQLSRRVKDGAMILTKKVVSNVYSEWERMACMPATLHMSMFFSVTSICAILYYGASSTDIWVVEILEILLIMHWNALENGADVELFNECRKVFKTYADAAYFVSFGEITGNITEIKRRDLKEKYNRLRWYSNARLLLPVVIATLINAYFVFRVWVIVTYCVCSCPPWDVKCYSLIFVPRAVIFVLNASFMVLYKRKFLKQHWFHHDS